MGSLGWYPQSNGKAENAVKQAKILMEKKTLQSKSDPFLVLLEIRDISFRNHADFSKSKVV